MVCCWAGAGSVLSLVFALPWSQLCMLHAQVRFCDRTHVGFWAVVRLTTCHQQSVHISGDRCNVGDFAGRSSASGDFAGRSSASRMHVLMILLVWAVRFEVPRPWLPPFESKLRQSVQTLVRRAASCQGQDRQSPDEFVLASRHQGD